jgi:uncharacterized protein (TIGR02246 family)
MNSTPPADLDTDRAQLEALMAQERTAHMSRNAPLLVSLFADDFINIGDGAIHQPGRAESVAGFQAYFDRSRFLVWDDIEPPIIRISVDGSMAYAIVHKRVRLFAAMPDETTREHETVFAWLEAWEKRDGRWQLQVIASTRAAESEGEIRHE